MSEPDPVSECEALIDNLAEVLNGQQLLTIAAAVGHVVGRAATDPGHMFAFFETLAANAALYATCTCGECAQDTKH